MKLHVVKILEENIDLDAEALIVLDLVDAAVKNMKGAEEWNIVTRMDCRKVSELLTSKKLKASELAGDSGPIISKIIDLENKTKVEFEHVHAKMKGSEDKTIKKNV